MDAEVNVLDLFSGIGGFSLGLERAGMRTVAFCEIDPYCRAVLAKHWPDVPVFGDVRELKTATLSDSEYDGPPAVIELGGSSLQRRLFQSERHRIDVICGGFPCQDISVAGKGAGIGGERSGLWSEYARIIGEVRPRYVIVENVAALLGRGLERVLGDLAALGFDAEWHCIPASAVGAPHRRDRVWIVAQSVFNGSQGSFRAELQGIPSGEHQSAGGSSDVAHAASANVLRAGPQQRVEGPLGLCGYPWGNQNEDFWQSSDWWATEPDVGRVAHGVPAELDGSRNGKEKHSAEASTEGNSGNDGMSGMRGNGTIGTAPSRLFPAGLGASLMSELSRQGRPTGWDATQEGDAALRTLREGVHADAQQETQSVQSGMPRHRWPHECGEALGEIWATEPDIGRVTHGVQNRVDRIRALGNAVVPQIPEIIGRAIMKAERE